MSGKEFDPETEWLMSELEDSIRSAIMKPMVMPTVASVTKYVIEAMEPYLPKFEDHVEIRPSADGRSLDLIAKDDIGRRFLEPMLPPPIKTITFTIPL